MRITYTILLALLCTVAQAKDYGKYYELINKAGEAFVNKEVKTAYQLYDKAFSAYKQPYVKDCYIAAQIAYASGDTNRFLRYLGIAFANGMPLTAYPAAKILRSTLQNEQLYAQVKAIYKKNSTKFVPDIAESDKLELLSYTNDSLKKLASIDKESALRFWAHEEKMRAYIEQQYIAKGTFPSEKMFGITSEATREDFKERWNKEPLFDKAQFEKDFKLSGMSVNIADAPREEYSLRYTTGYNVFVHYTCTWKEYKDKLWRCVENGYLSPKEYGLLYETSVLWNRSSPTHKLNKMCDYEPEQAYFNILYKDPFKQQQTYTDSPELLPIVEANRAKYYIQKFSVDKELKKLGKEHGFKFFFGFMNMS